MPRPPKDPEPSVYRVRPLAPPDIVALGKANIPNARRIFGYGEITVAGVSLASSDLSVRPKEPPERHALLTGWPVNRDVEVQKARCLQIATLLANKASLKLAPQDETNDAK